MDARTRADASVLSAWQLAKDATSARMSALVEREKANRDDVGSSSHQSAVRFPAMVRRHFTHRISQPPCSAPKPAAIRVANALGGRGHAELEAWFVATLSDPLWHRNRVLAEVALEHTFVQITTSGELSRSAFAQYETRRSCHDGGSRSAMAPPSDQA